MKYPNISTINKSTSTVATSNVTSCGQIVTALQPDGGANRIRWNWGNLISWNLGWVFFVAKSIQGGAPKRYKFVYKPH
jgi:hypothetical protein